MLKGDFYMFDCFKGINLKDFSTVSAAFGEFGLVPSLIAVIACIVLAFFAYKIFKLAITVSVALGFGLLGNWLTPIVLNGVAIPESIKIVPIVTFALAIIGALLAMWLYKIAVFANGAALGYFVGKFAVGYLGANGAGIAFFDGTAGKIVVSVVCAIIVAFLVVFFYKYIYIILTSIASMAVVGAIIGAFVYPTFTLYALIAGAVIGLIPMIYQFKSADEM
jgi:hypothetical protein